MRLLLAIIVSTCALASSSGAQIRPFPPCKAGTPSIIGESEHVSVQRVTFLEDEHEYAATVFVPRGAGPLPGILFSHSMIRNAVKRTDLTRFAFALARAGAASIVLDGIVEWERPDNTSRRSAHLLACAGQWLLVHTAVDRAFSMFAGHLEPWGGGDTSFCRLGESPCFGPDAGIIGFGQTTPVEYRNTDLMLSSEGQFRLATFAQKQLRLSGLKSEWFITEPNPRP